MIEQSGTNAGNFLLLALTAIGSVSDDRYKAKREFPQRLHPERFLGLGLLKSMRVRAIGDENDEFRYLPRRLAKVTRQDMSLRKVRIGTSLTARICNWKRVRSNESRNVADSKRQPDNLERNAPPNGWLRISFGLSTLA